MKRETAQRHSLKIIAIFFAVSLWFYVLNSEPIEVEKKLSISYIVPKGYAIANISEKELTLKLKGSKAFLQNLFSNNEKLKVDLKPYFISSGKSFKVKFYANEISVPFGVEIVDVFPKETLIVLDRRVSMEIPIKVKYIGDAPKNRRIKEILISPPSIAVSGPIDILKTLSKLESAPVNLAFFDQDEGETFISLADLDQRLNYDESLKIKLNYRTQVISTKKMLKKNNLEELAPRN